MKALQTLRNPGEVDLRAELLGTGIPLSYVEPAPPTLWVLCEPPRPLSRYAHFAALAAANIPFRVADENKFFRAAAVQKALEIALDVHTKQSTSYRPYWPNIYKEAIRYIAKHSPSPVCDQAARCEPERSCRQGTSKDGEFVYYDGRAGREVWLPTKVLELGISIPSRSDETHDVSKMWFMEKEWRVRETGETVTLGGDTITKQCVIIALACAELPDGGRDKTVAEIQEKANEAYKSVLMEGTQCWKKFHKTPKAARCHFLQARESSFDLAHHRDNNISMPMYFGTDRWRYVRFIIIKSDSRQHVAMDVIDDVEFSLHSRRSKVMVVLLLDHHLRPAYLASGTMSPLESETFILDAEARQPHKACVPACRMMAICWRRIADYADTSVWAAGDDMGEDELTGDKVRLAGLAAPDVASGRVSSPPDQRRGGGGGATGLCSETSRIRRRCTAIVRLPGLEA